jgi:hypothetical protein
VEILRLFPAPADASGVEFAETGAERDFSPSPNLVAAEFEFRLGAEAA